MTRSRAHQCGIIVFGSPQIGTFAGLVKILLAKQDSEGGF